VTKRLILCCALFFASALGVSGSAPMTMTASPALTKAPAVVTVRVLIEPNPENRSLEIVADSRDYYTSSSASLDGAHAPRLKVLELKDLPTGLYEVTCTLRGVNGRRVAHMQVVRVEPRLGGR
jgi:hypothetical protein